MFLNCGTNGRAKWKGRRGRFLSANDRTLSVSSHWRLEQPVTLAFKDGERDRRYTPDFLVRSGDDRRAGFIEVKYRSDLRAQWARLKPAFRAARRWGQAHYASFGIATEREIRGPMLENAKCLLPLRYARLDPELADLAFAASRGQRHPTFGTVIGAMQVDRARALATVWRLIARGAFRVDTTQPITVDTDIQ